MTCVISNCRQSSLYKSVPSSRARPLRRRSSTHHDCNVLLVYTISGSYCATAAAPAAVNNSQKEKKKKQQERNKGHYRHHPSSSCTAAKSQTNPQDPSPGPVVLYIILLYSRVRPSVRPSVYSPFIRPSFSV